LCEIPAHDSHFDVLNFGILQSGKEFARTSGLLCNIVLTQPEPDMAWWNRALAMTLAEYRRA
jgi:hypothetical protein